ncbi:hypothetical protein EBZ70_09315 [bacterium]|nr:hypothetical protein [bacterium]
MRFRPEQHLRRQGDFDHIRNVGRRFDCGAFTVFYAPRRPPLTPVNTTDAPPPTAPAPARAGFVASRSAVGNAVARARAKRRLREGFRAHQAAFPPDVNAPAHLSFGQEYVVTMPRLSAP